jgi:hypothetical protein
MDRRVSNWWLALFWIPVLALVVGLMLGCATPGASEAPVLAAPPKAELRRLVAQTFNADSPFDSFAAQGTEAQRVAAVFRPVVADVTARECRAVTAESLDCTLEIVLQFPEMGGRESRTTWERRLRHSPAGWRILGATP